MCQGKITLHDLDVIVRQLDNLPALPAAAARALELTDPGVRFASEVSETARELTAVLSADQALAARLLWLANSSTSKPVRTVSAAIDVLGIEAVRAVVQSNRTCCPAGGPTGEVDPDLRPFWRHSLAVAIGARVLAEEIELPVDGEEVFLAGLFHDIGKLLLIEVLPKSYAKSIVGGGSDNGNITEWERKAIGVDHLAAGRRLAHHWCLGDAVEAVIWLHHQPSEAIPATRLDGALVRIVALADSMAYSRRIGVSGNTVAAICADCLASELGFNEARMAAIETRLDERLAKNASLLGLADAEMPAPDPASLARAGAELARFGERMRLHHRGLAVQADAFSAVNGFSEGLSLDSTLPDVLVKLAETFRRSGAELPSDDAVVAYSLDHQAGTMLAVRLGSDGRPDWRTFHLAAEVGVRALPGDRAGATEAMGRLLDDIDTWGMWANITDGCHLGLTSDGRWLGGVVCPAESADETRRAALGTLGLTLGLVQQRGSAEAIGEKLAGASQLLAETRNSLAEAKTIAAMGELAAGAGHELNTPLAVVSGRAQIMQQRAKSPEERRTWQTIADQAQRISDIVTELMEFATPPEPRIRAFDVNTTLADAAKSFSSSDHPQAESCSVDIETENDVPAALADREQIKAVLRELIANAAASPARLVVLSASVDQSRRNVVLKVRDDGPGMNAKTLARAYTPFFSSHKAGRRRGLGLPKALRYAESNGGRMSIESEPGKGTTVSVQLPTAGKEALEGDEDHDSQQDSPSTGS